MSAQFISLADLSALATAILTGAGFSDAHAQAVTDHMVWANAADRPNYGVWRLPILTRRCEEGVFDPDAQPAVDRRSDSLALVDGRNAIGHVVATFAADLAVDMARSAGVATLAVRRSNFVGALGYYVDRIARAGMIGFLVSNAHPRVAAHGGTSPVLGTNPLAFGTPLPDGRTLIVDLATSAAAGSLITRSAELGVPLPEGVAVDRDGAPITDATQVGKGAMLPLGGPKGFGLGLMVEVLAGVLTGAGISHGVHSQYKDFTNPGDSGHLVQAMDVDAFMSRSVFDQRMETLVAAVTESGEVRLPGAARWDALAHSEQLDGVTLDPDTVEALESLAKRYRVEVPWTAADAEGADT
jgi:LDH2 family malate/lactate/ureidoglycolate dehydrogenase